tara:strand:- start:9221 stop:9919 length:699 start_codon:yes stop_codon:yes gene_type:complete
MATTNELTYDVLEDVRSHHVVDDEDIDDRQLIHKYNVQRSLWIRNELNKPGRTIDPFTIQSLGCVELEVADTSDCPGMPVGCSILRTKCELPKTVELHQRNAITKVGPIDKMDYFFSFVSYHQAIFSGSGKYNGNSIFAFLHGNRMYFKVNSSQQKLLKNVNIMGIFEDPTKVAGFCQQDGAPCFDKDSQYPISSWMIPFIHEEVVRQVLRSIPLPEDNTNDANSNEARSIE